MKRLFALCGLCVVMGILFFLFRNTTKEKPMPLPDFAVQKFNNGNLQTVSNRRSIHNSSVKKENKESKLGKKWRDLVDEIEGQLDTDFFMPLSKYNQDLAGLLVDYYVDYLRKGFKYFYTNYVSATSGLSNADLNKKISLYEGKIFKNIPGIIVQNNTKLKEKALPYYEIEKKLTPLLADGVKVIFFMVKRYKSGEINSMENNYKKAGGFYTNEKLLKKIPFVSIPVALKIELYYIAERIASFFDENDIQK